MDIRKVFGLNMRRLRLAAELNRKMPPRLLALGARMPARWSGPAERHIVDFLVGCARVVEAETGPAGQFRAGNGVGVRQRCLLSEHGRKIGFAVVFRLLVAENVL